MIIELPPEVPEELLAKAHATAKHAHRNHKRKITGQPYIVHPEAVAARLEERQLKVLGLLHDVMEDNPEEYPEAVMRELFPAWVVDHLLLLTRQPLEPYDHFIIRAASNPATKAVKIVDIRDNLRTLDKGSLRDKYRLALRFLGEDPDRWLLTTVTAVKAQTSEEV